MANFTDKQKLKKAVSAVLAAALVTNAGAALMAINSQPTSAALTYTNDSDSENVTRIMMDGNNMLKYGYFMNAVRTTNSDNVTYNINLKFKIPGYDPNNLKFFIFNKNRNMVENLQEYTLQSGLQDPTPSIYLKDFTASSYEVHVYNGSLNENNFVCKSDFIATPENNWQTNTAVDLKDAAGQPIYDEGAGGNLQILYVKPGSLNTSQFFIGLPTQFASGKQLIPYWARTIKVAFFATNRENDEPLNMDKVLYEYVYKGPLGLDAATGKPIMTGDNLMFVPDAQYGVGTAGSPVTYEVHFYANEVKEGNFICKATGISAL